MKTAISAGWPGPRSSGCAATPSSQTLAAFLKTNPGDQAQEEAQKVLSLIADTDEDETVREAARAAHFPGNSEFPGK